MESDPPPSSTPKKPKFTPKAPPRRKGRLALPKNESSDIDDGEAAKALLRKVNERLGTRGPKVDKKSSGNAASARGASAPMKTYGNPKDAKNNEGGSSNSKDFANKSCVPSSSIATKDRDVDVMVIDDEFESTNKTKEEYKEPWDYHRSYYPTVLPWRRPYSGNPELRDEEEFGEKHHDEKSINSASELGLLEENEELQMLFFKLPPSLPLDKQKGRVSAAAKGKEKVDSPMDPKAPATPTLRENTSNRCCRLEELPGGYLGKMLVYKSGAIKIKLGDTLFDVSSGTPCTFAQDVVVMNTKTKDCGMLGELNKQAVVTPDIDSILDGINLN